MRRFFAALAILTGVALAPESVSAQTSPCLTNAAVLGVPCQRLTGRFYAPAPNTGVEVEALITTGTQSATTFLRGDGMWETPAGGGGTTYTDADVQNYLVEGLDADTVGPFPLVVPHANQDTLLGFDANNPNGLSKFLPSAFKSIVSIYRGPYDSAVAYSRGDIVSGGSGLNTVFYRAASDIGAGAGTPTFLNRYNWIVTSHQGHYLGTLNTGLTYQIRGGDRYEIADEAYLATEAISNATGTTLSTGSGVLHLTAEHAHQPASRPPNRHLVASTDSPDRHGAAGALLGTGTPTILGLPAR